MIALIGGLALIALVTLFWLSRTGRFYLSHPHGFYSFGSPGKSPREATRTQLSAALYRLVQADRFDLLWIFINEAEEGRSFGVHLEQGQPYVEASFPLAGHEGEAFKAVAEEAGLELLEQEEFNEGLGEELESEYLTFQAPSNPKELSEVVLKIIDGFFPAPNRENLYLTASSLSNGPLQRSGVVWRREVDLLDGVI